MDTTHCYRCHDYVRDCICEECRNCGQLVGPGELDSEADLCEECVDDLEHAS